MENLDAQIRQIFMEVTRYPAEILDPASDLEDDLGIDSVKRGEIFALLRERYHLPEKLDIPQERLRTIGNITEAIRTFLNQSSAADKKEGPETFQRMAVNNPPAVQSGYSQHRQENIIKDTTFPAKKFSREDIHQIVITTLMEFTHHPKEILSPAADMEKDLGIDFMKRLKIFAALRERFGISEAVMADSAGIHTIEDVVSSIADILLVGSQLPNAAVLNHPQNSQTKLRLESSSGDISFLSHADQKPFLGKVALVTGSGHGLGKVIACRLAELGAYVVINSFHSRDRGDETVSEIISTGGQAIHLWGSVANTVHLNKIFDEIESKFGVLDFFISNASNGILAPLKDVTVDYWEKAFQTNVIGLHQSAMRSAELMKRRNCGKIITLSSPGASRYIEYFGCMGAVKAAVESLTRSLAVELASYNICVNAVSPSAVYGELISMYPDSKRLIPIWESKSTGNRLCKPTEVADAIAFLLSEKANFINGSIFVIDGGLSLRGLD